MKLFSGAVTSIFKGVRGLLRDLVYRLAAERRQRRLAELDELLAWASARGLTLEQTIAIAPRLGYRRHARALRELRASVTKALPPPGSS